VRYVLNALYLIAIILLSPWLVYKALTAGKYRRGLWQKILGLAPLRGESRPCAWFHGVSVGEIHLLQAVIASFRRRHPDWDCVVSTTTDTGFAEAAKRFPDLHHFFWPLDFTWAVRRALRRVNPRLVVLAEGELWPNFLAAAKENGIAVTVINGRLSPRSFRRYHRLGRCVRRMFQPVDFFAVQTQEYALHYRRLGVDPERVRVTDSVKYDGVATDRRNPRTEALRRLLGVAAGDAAWVAGSTQAPEEEFCLAIFQRLRPAFPNLRLFLVPRQKDRFDAVARLIRRTGMPFTRRSQLRPVPGERPAAARDPVVLVDTIGELGAVWGLADVAFVGGSLDGRRGGQNMIEPAAYGAAVLFGPHVWNFRDTARRLVQAGGAIQVSDAPALESALRTLLESPDERQRRGALARQLVQTQQGATERTVDWLDRLPAVWQATTRAA
jgi:3-deoxy-D-manno-octulosonic-acid transferase